LFAIEQACARFSLPHMEAGRSVSPLQKPIPCRFILCSQGAARSFERKK
jgi:hypothetical protein